MAFSAKCLYLLAALQSIALSPVEPKEFAQHALKPIEPGIEDGASFVQTGVQWGKAYKFATPYDAIRVRFEQPPERFDIYVGTCFKLAVRLNDNKIYHKSGTARGRRHVLQNINIHEIQIKRYNKFQVKLIGWDKVGRTMETFYVLVPTVPCVAGDPRIFLPKKSKGFGKLMVERVITTEADDGTPAEDSAIPPATQQKSTAMHGDSRHAVGDSRDTKFSSHSCTLTKADSPNQWWRMDLRRVSTIRAVKLLTRSDGPADSLDNFIVTIGDTIEPLVTGLSNHTVCDKEKTGVVSKGQAVRVSCLKNGSPVMGRYITVQRTDNKPLSFCHAMVLRN